MMNTDTTYNGYTNWDTWNAQMWTSGGDEWVYKTARDLPDAETLRKFIVEECGLRGDGFDPEEVNWQEVFEAVTEE